MQLCARYVHYSLQKQTQLHNKKLRLFKLLVTYHNCPHSTLSALQNLSKILTAMGNPNSIL